MKEVFDIHVIVHNVHFVHHVNVHLAQEEEGFFGADEGTIRGPCRPNKSYTFNFIYGEIVFLVICLNSIRYCYIG